MLSYADADWSEDGDGDFQIILIFLLQLMDYITGNLRITVTHS